MSGITDDSFSKRYGFRPEDPPISIWEDAPSDFRHEILKTAEDCGLTPDDLRDVVCRVLRKKPDPSNWTPYPNVWSEVECHVENCEWYRVYDIIEAIYGRLQTRTARLRGKSDLGCDFFAARVNDLMSEFGIGWQLRDGFVQARGEEAYEIVLRDVDVFLGDAGRTTAQSELQEAVRDISRRPSPDITGAIQHSMAALECVVRDVTGKPKLTLGELTKRHKDLFPPPVDVAVEKLWGFASENARHVREGLEPTREEAMLVVGLAATLANYLIHKMKDVTSLA